MARRPALTQFTRRKKKVDLQTPVGVLSPISMKCGNAKKYQKIGGKGLIVKIPIKGDISVCDYSRGITLLSIPNKVFCRNILNQDGRGPDDSRTSMVQSRKMLLRSKFCSEKPN